MNYIITAARQIGDSIVTEVIYELDGETLSVSIPHFRPRGPDDIDTGIRNRLASERSRMDATSTCAAILSQIEIDQPIPL